MSDIEKSIAYLKASIKYAEEDSTNLNDAKEVKNIISTAIQSLEKQMPKKVECFNGLNETVCLECRFVFGYSLELGEYEGEKYNYCYHCGQKLDWSVDNEN